ncbi:WW domain binding protein-2 [Schizosaccharomyces japonicus yFS275]|uniref:WW domain binding protein-2 n=1 Tax=Schizosaccharomyces japonicus (strain yFS275 / FY16936) TaxID=402676 RepID=B6JXM4_SCHJY|nr:WW domain binding protein-2 [Schizosaccharomyces japonicus yFS275]EEB05168.1 WW domain binding protein-2 [Schizosaccharomyces japonicus yFS275]
MSVNWVTFQGEDVKEPYLLEEEFILKTYGEIALSLLCVPPSNKSWTSTSGKLYLTNKRLIYVPTTSTDDFKSFQTPICNLKDTKLNQPFFGANYYSGLVVPVQNGGIPSDAEMRLQFNEGGIFDFVESLQRLIQRYQEVGNVGHVQHLEPLPPYHRPSSSQDRPPLYDDAVRHA